jgi:hypothetical protein
MADVSASCAVDGGDCGCGPSRLRCVAIAAMILAAMAAFLPIAYGANDDSGHPLTLAPPPGMENPAGSPADPLLTWMSVTLSSALAWLYRAVPGWPWYGLALAAGNALGAGLVGHALWRAKLPPVLRGLLLLGAGTVLFDIFFWWTFTKTMMVLQYAGFLQALAWQVEGRKERFPYVAVILPLCLGFLFRWNFFLRSAAFAVPIVFLFRPRDFMPAAFVGACFAGVFAFDQTLRTRMADADAGYLEWNVFQDQRSPFHDHPAGEPNAETPKALAAAGWVEDDYLWFRRVWSFYDRDTFNAETIKAFMKVNGEAARIASPTWDYTVGLKRALGHLRDNAGYLLAGLLPAAALFAAWRRQPRGAMYRRQAAGLLGVAAFFLYLLYFRLPDRVGGPTIMYTLGVLALFASGTPWTPRRGIGLLLLASAGVWWYVGMNAIMLHRYGIVRTGYAEFLGALPAELKKQVVVPLDPTVGFMPETNHPLREELNYDRGLQVVPVGTKVNSPVYLRFLERHGYKSGREMLVGAMKGQPALFFSCNDKDYVQPLWLSYLNRRLAPIAGRKVKFETVAASADGRMSLLRLVPDGK